MNDNLLADTLREIADRLESAGLNPDTVTFNLHGLDRQQLVDFARAFPGPISKNAGASSFWLTAHIGGLDVTAFARDRAEVCRRVVTGTEHVPEQTTPAHTREIVEWECEPLLATVDHVEGATS